MTNSITQSIGVGAANTITTRPDNQHNKQNNTPTDVKQVISNTQISAQASTHAFSTIGTKERDKIAPQVPKRVEAPYSSKENKKKVAHNSKEEEKEESSADTKLDLLA
ncbi:MAG: hypothetical protein SGJ02_06395 [bacterium]|nr:hypothetical protein [bacterium]